MNGNRECERQCGMNDQQRISCLQSNLVLGAAAQAVVGEFEGRDRAVP